jgi:hypothetical protein
MGGFVKVAGSKQRWQEQELTYGSMSFSKMLVM